MPIATDRLRMLLINTFIFLIAFVWADELIDMPRVTSGGQPTPINWVEALIETVVIAAVGFLTVTRFFSKGEEKSPRGLAREERYTWITVSCSFLGLCCMVWLNEIIDVPYLLLQGEKTPLNWSEAAVETFLIIIVGGIALSILMRKIRERDRAQNLFFKSFYFNPVGASITSLNNNTIIHVNEAFSATTGYRPEQIVGKSMEELNMWAFQEERNEVITALHKEGSVRNVEVSIRDIEGNYKTVLYSADIIDYVGEQHVLSAAIDITDRKRTQDLLIKTETKYRDMFMHSIQGIAVYSETEDGDDFVIMDINKAGERIDRIKKADVMGKTVSEIFPGIREFGLLDGLKRVWKSGEAEHLPASYYNDGRIDGWRDNYLYKLASGEIVALYSDETARKNAEKELCERQRELLISEEKFSKAFHASSDLITISTLKNGVFIDVNDMFLKTLSYSLKEVIGHSAIDLGMWGNREKRDLMTDIVLKQGKIRNYEVNLHTKDGNERTMLVSADRFVFQGEDCMLMISRDITDRKRMEEQIRLSEKQLRDLYKNLQETRETERTRISREIHDDLGQELTVLKLEIQQLAHTLPEDDDAFKKKTAIIIDHIDLAIDSMRRISMDLRPALLDQLGLIAAIEWQAEDFQKRAGVPCFLTIDPGITIVNTKLSTTLFRIFQETLTNITRYASASKVNAALRKLPDALELTVSDDGKGITEAEIENPKSFGIIGMKERVSDWGGTIEISGKRGRGTTVRVSIPFSVNDIKETD